MNGSPPPFDPSKPFTTEGAAPPPFDPSKPFTDAPAASAQPTAPQPSTTAPGLAASLARGAAPYAAGAAVGAAAGAPFFGVGAVPGAIAGMGAVGATELGGAVYNWMGAPLGHFTTPKEATDKLMDTFGIRRPSTALEHSAEDVGGMLPFGVTSTQGIKDLVEGIASNKADAAERFIKKSYERAIKPSVAGKATATQLDRYHDQARDAISSIVANKAGLRFTDGAVETAGELPKSLEQFADAIDQTKQTIFQRYDALAQQAGQAGARVDLTATVGELQKLASDTVVKDLHPELGKYAEDRAAAMTARGSYSTSEAQRAVSNLNQSLKAFYSNPGYETASKASVDALIANQLRGGLDQAIESATAPGYQALKNQYGALKAIEKDVVNRSIVNARKEAGGGILGRISDVASAEEVLRGVITMNPAAIARGVALKGWQSYVQRLRDPNRAVQKLFEAAEKRGGADVPSAGAPPEVSLGGGPQLPRPTDAGGGIPASGAGTGGMPVGGSVGPNPAPLPQMPPQGPRTDFEGLSNMLGFF
ncbi:MAG TPA: hypothetical protein VFV07_09860 [Rhizomicrobium sp.]|nr:hypothetical protein [Rhizomicrobium sp.]